MKKVTTYCEAINEGLVEEMRKDPRIFVYGIDVGDHKKIYGTLNGIKEEFGPLRCFSTPLCEDTLVGFGLGAAINGLKPVNIHIRVDFLLLAMNQLVNMVANYRYGSGDKLTVPLTIRAVIGRTWGQSYQHSKSLHSFFAHIPGLRVLMPSNPQDAKDLLAYAIQGEDPTIVIEHRLLYDFTGEVDPQNRLPLNKARILRRGSDITVIATSWMNVEALKAAQFLENSGVNIEIIDPRTISPIDEETIINSVYKTGHCIIADFDWLSCGFSAELSATISEKCFGKLRSPIKRIGFAPTHCPASRPLENLFYPNAVDIIHATESKLDIRLSDISREDFYTDVNRFRGPF